MTIYKKGSKSDVVKKIQTLLHLYPDGIYGEMTEEGVMEYQKAHGLKADGIVGPATLSMMGITVVNHYIKPIKSRRTINEIIIHCSATPEGKHYTVEDIRRWHKEKGWSDIGYHYVVQRDGAICVGRDINISGAHCKGHNAHSIGVCYVGGLAKDGKTPKDTRTDLQQAAMLTLLCDLRKLYPKAPIYGHHDFDPKKDCPCFDAKGEYGKEKILQIK